MGVGKKLYPGLSSVLCVKSVRSIRVKQQTGSACMSKYNGGPGRFLKSVKCLQGRIII